MDEDDDVDEDERDPDDRRSGTISSVRSSAMSFADDISALLSLQQFPSLMLEFNATMNIPTLKTKEMEDDAIGSRTRMPRCLLLPLLPLLPPLSSRQTALLLHRQIWRTFFLLSLPLQLLHSRRNLM